MQTGYLKRLKASVPFSDTLNAEIKRITNEIFKTGIEMELVDNDPFNDFANPIEYFEYMKKMYREEKKIQIWTGGTDNNIYGSPEMNYLFRFWHDHTHIVTNHGFTAEEEIKVGQIQQLCIVTNNYDRLLVGADVTGQVVYHSMYGEFPTNQREFCIKYLETGICYKQF